MNGGQQFLIQRNCRFSEGGFFFGIFAKTRLVFNGIIELVKRVRNFKPTPIHFEVGHAVGCAKGEDAQCRHGDQNARGHASPFHVRSVVLPRRSRHGSQIDSRMTGQFILERP